MPRLFERTASAVGAFETSKWLWITFQGGSLLASFGVTAWAAWAAAIFVQYAPLSWVVAGFIGAATWTLIRLLWTVIFRIRVRARYDANFLTRGPHFNPLDLTFERKRIYISDFVLPSHPQIEGKTFIDCDIIGPANVYFHSSNLANPIKPPLLEAFWLHPKATFGNGFTLKNCIFRNCSFQRITMFASVGNYREWRDNPNISWIGLDPTPEIMALWDTVVSEARERAGLPPLTSESPSPLLQHDADPDQGTDKPVS